MFTAWVIFHVVVCIALILVVLMQSAKGEGLAGSMFGGGGGGMGGAVFGGRGAASFLSKATTALAVLFMLNCGALAFMSASPTGSTATGGGGDGDSPITRQAQAERDRAMQQQQQQAPLDQSPGGDTAGSVPIQLTPGEPTSTEQPATSQPETGGESGGQ